MKKKDLEEIRQNIDQIDDEIFECIIRRMECVEQVRLIKEGSGESTYQPGREHAVYQRVLEKNKGRFPQDVLKVIYREIMSLSKRLEGGISVGYLGSKASFSWQAAVDTFGISSEYVGATSISELFSWVASSHVHYAVVPIENSQEGTVKETFSLLLDHKVQILGELYRKVEHALLGHEGQDIKKVYSHPQALGQCRRYLFDHFRGVECIPVKSTSEAAAKVEKLKDSVAIGHHSLADYYDLNVLGRNIEDNQNNETRFFIIGREKTKRTGKDKTTLVFSLENKPGTLLHVLGFFSKEKVNVFKVDSRPSEKMPWSYSFLLDVEGHAEDPTLKRILDSLKKDVPSLLVCGSYINQKECQND